MKKMTLAGLPDSNQNYVKWIAIVCASVLGYLTVLDTFWFHDDWFFLSNAAGLSDLDKGGSRWFSYVGYWKLLYPLFGLNPIGWGISRLLLHVGSVCLVIKIGQRVGLKSNVCFFGGLFFAYSPVVFESLYWGTGAIELMGVFFALASIERWLKGSSFALILSVVFGVIAIGSKEAGLFLPVLYFVQMLVNRDFRRGLWVVVIILGLTAVVSGILLATNLEGSSEYSLSITSIPKNFLLLGFWLLAPAKFQTGNEIEQIWPLITGAAIWLTWSLLAIRQFRNGNKVSLIALVVCLLSMLPAVPLANHIVPRYNYGPIAAAALSVSFIAHSLLARTKMRWFYLLAIVVAGINWFSTDYRLNAKYPNGRLIHRLVVKEEVSRSICSRLGSLNLSNNDRLVFFIEPNSNELEIKLLQEALGGALGPELVIGRNVQITWVTHLTAESSGAYVISVNGLDLEPMGRYAPRR